MKDIDFYKRLSNYLLDCKSIECANCEFNTGEDFGCNILEITSESISDLIEEINKLNRVREKIIESVRDSFAWCFGYKRNDDCEYIDECNSNNDYYEFLSTTQLEEYIKDSFGAITDLSKQIDELNKEIKDSEECSIEQHNEIHYWRDRAKEAERKLEWIKESLRIVGDSDYYNYFNEWEIEAENNGYKEEWLAKIGEWVKLYCLDCDSKEEEPTFDGLFIYIKKLCEGEDVF